MPFKAIEILLECSADNFLPLLASDSFNRVSFEINLPICDFEIFLLVSSDLGIPILFAAINLNFSNLSGVNFRPLRALDIFSGTFFLAPFLAFSLHKSIILYPAFLKLSF